MVTRPTLRGSLALRLAVVFGLLSAVVVAALGIGIHALAARFLSARAEEDLAALAEFYAAYAATAAPDETQLAALAPQIVGYFAPQAGYEVRIFSIRTGAVLGTTHQSIHLPSAEALVELGRVRPTLYLSPSSNQPKRQYVARPVLATDGSALAVVELSRDIGDRESFLLTLRKILLVAGGSAVVTFTAAGVLLARQMTRPLRQMESATRAIATGDFERRVPVSTGDEIGRLAVSVNRMAQDLARLEASRREFIARISHDLRTPLTAIKGFIVNLQDVAPDSLKESLAAVDEQTDRLIRLVNDLLTLSRLQRGELRLTKTDIDLAAAAQSAIALVHDKALRSGIELTLIRQSGELTAVDCCIHGDSDRLQQVILNLLDNAVRATPAGGSVEVRVVGQEKEVTLTVTDTGRGLTPEDAQRAFEPYYRGEGGGAGLGLSIAREVVEGHGGKVWLRPRPGDGTEAGFTLPRSTR